jgi:hypothetical protein
LNSKQREIVEQVARHFSATLESADGSAPWSVMTVAGRRIAIRSTVIERTLAQRRDLIVPRLRFDRVALRFVEEMRTRLPVYVPDGRALIVTIMAPIRLASKTVAALEVMVPGLLARRARDKIETACGNSIRVRVVKSGTLRAAKVMGFVHSAEADSGAIVGLTETLLEHIGAAERKPAPGKLPKVRWLIIADEEGLPRIETYRHLYAQLGVSVGFDKIVLVLAGGRVDVLAR